MVFEPKKGVAILPYTPHPAFFKSLVFREL